jgi:hypothetical protein
MMTTGCGNLQRAAGEWLAADIGEIRQLAIEGVRDRRGRGWCDAGGICHHLRRSTQRVDGEGAHAGNDGGFDSVAR